MTFVDDYLNFIGEYPESSYRRELDAIYRRSQRALGRYQGLPADEELEELDSRAFEKERRRMARSEAGQIRKGAKANERLVDATEDAVIIDGMINEAEAKSMPAEKKVRNKRD